MDSSWLKTGHVICYSKTKSTLVGTTSSLTFFRNIKPDDKIAVELSLQMSRDLLYTQYVCNIMGLVARVRYSAQLRASRNEQPQTAAAYYYILLP